MANRIEFTTYRPTDNYVIQSSRYANSTIVYYGPLHKLTFTIYQRKPTKFSDQDMFMVVPAGFEYRPDLVSKRVYGTVDFWWKILEMNGMKDVFEFKAGVNIRLPHNVFGL